MSVYQGLSLTLVGQDVEKNESYVALLWQTTQTGGSYNHYARQARYTVTGPTGAKTYTLEYRLQKNTTHPILETTLTVPHGSDGAGFVTVDTWLDTDISAGVIELHEQLALPDIPRASTLGATDAAIGAVSAIAVSRKRADFTHTIAVSFGGLSGYLDHNGNLTAAPVKLTRTNLAFFLPESFYGAIPNAPSGVCRLTCTTWLGDTQIGQSQQTHFTVIADPARCGPLLTWDITDHSPATALTGDPRVFVRYISQAVCSLTAQARHGATLLGCTAAGLDAMDGPVAIENIQVDTLPLRAWDSRGYEVQAQAQLQMVPYIPLTCQATLRRTDPTSGNALLEVTGNFYHGSFGAAENALTLTCQIDGADPVTLEWTATEEGYTARLALTGLDYKTSHTARVAAADRCMALDITAPMGRGIPVFDWGENDFAFHVPVHMEAGFTLGGSGLVDLMYPVGSIYLAWHEENPAQLFGGSWQRIYGRFLWAAEAMEAIGSQGGEKTHTLTVNEIPSHHHTGVRRSDSAVSGGVSQAASAGGNDTDYRTDKTGGGAAHNNMPPFVAIYAWRRVA